MRVQAHVEVSAPPSAIWPILVDPEQLPTFMAGLTRWEPVGQPSAGLGARYRVHMLVGSAHVGGLVEVVEFNEQRDIAWTNVTGIDHRGRWRLRERRPGCTGVTLRVSYSAPGGLLAVLADRLAAPMVRRNLQRSLVCLRRMVEQRSA
ncbi:MAG TPA: SRPBCC family protein [Acidimicrobiales bacterium]|nr:SRPBCC family protein [Acidimicrobiales bacterium]